MNIFISYRRQDSEWVALSIFQELQKHFPKDDFFKDIDVIKPGEDFSKVIDKNLQKCDILLVVIGKKWLKIKDSEGNQRIFNEKDFVRYEIAKALKSNKKVIPVLVEGATMPSETTLPENIAKLHKKQSVTISNSNFSLDIYNLATAIKDATGTHDEYSSIVRDITKGNINEKELQKPTTNIILSIICLLVGLTILIFYYNETSKILLSAVLIIAGFISIFQSNQIGRLWLSHKFEEARISSKNNRTFSILTTLFGIGSLLTLNFIDSKKEEIKPIVVRNIPTLSATKTTKTVSLKSLESLTSKNTLRPLYPGKFPMASFRILTNQDMYNLSLQDLNLMRNEIFARKGLIFDSQTLDTYFRNQSWYSPRFTNVNDRLTETEKKNINFIQANELIKSLSNK
jgi:hypothetical protein